MKLNNTLKLIGKVLVIAFFLYGFVGIFKDNSATLGQLVFWIILFAIILWLIFHKHKEIEIELRKDISKEKR